MSELLLLRHAEPESAGLYIGRGSDPPLSSRGRTEARRIAGVIAAWEDRPEILYSSPQARAMETIAPLAKDLRIPVLPATGMEELDFGEWEGLGWKEIEERDPEFWRNWLDDPWRTAPPGGERLADLQDRVVCEINGILAKHPGRSVLVASHGGPIRAALGFALSLDPAAYWSVGIDYGSVSRFSRRNPGTLELLQWNVPLKAPPAAESQ